jgi:anti-sigma factor RsiW
MNNMIHCKEIANLIMDYLDGSLDPLDSQEFELHTTGCVDCHTFLNTYQKTVSLSHQLSCDMIPIELKNRLSTLLRKKGLEKEKTVETG